MLFKKIIEMQGLINSRTKALKLAERKIEDRNILIGDMEEEAKILYEEKKYFKSKYEENEELINRINSLVSSNKYNNEKAVFDKIKELISDYHSQNQF